MGEQAGCWPYPPTADHHLLTEHWPLQYTTLHCLKEFPHGKVFLWVRTPDPWPHSLALPSPQCSNARHDHTRHGWGRSYGAGIKTSRRQWTLSGQAGFRFRQHDQTFSRAEEQDTGEVANTRKRNLTSTDAQSQADTHFKTSHLYIYKPFIKSVHQTNFYTKIKQNRYPQTSNTNFWRVCPFKTAPVKKVHKVYMLVSVAIPSNLLIPEERKI